MSRERTGYLYLDLVVGLAVIDADDAANHFRYDDHVTQVSFHTLQHSIHHNNNTARYKLEKVDHFILSP